MIVYIKLGGLRLAVENHVLHQLNQTSPELGKLAYRLTAESLYLRLEHPFDIDWGLFPNHFPEDMNLLIRELRVLEASQYWRPTQALTPYAKYRNLFKLTADAHLVYCLEMAKWIQTTILDRNLKHLPLSYLDLYQLKVAEMRDRWRSTLRVENAEKVSRNLMSFLLFDTTVDADHVARLLIKVNELHSPN